jgi:hypothetical protein
MYRLIAILLWTVSASTASAQASFGLVCSTQSESVPRLLTISGASVQVFDYGEETWKFFLTKSVDGDKITGKMRYENSFNVNRIDGSWRSSTDMNYKTSITTATGICVRKALNEMGQVAADYLAQLNARRAF